MKITVFSLLRDSEKSLPEFFGHLEALEKEHPDDELEYYLYENDSRDNTVKLVKEWLKDREGDLLSEKLQAIKWNSTTPAGKRMMFMAECRQKLLDFARPLKSDLFSIFYIVTTFRPIVNSYSSFIRYSFLFCYFAYKSRFICFSKRPLRMSGLKR